MTKLMVTSIIANIVLLAMAIYFALTSDSSIASFICIFLYLSLFACLFIIIKKFKTKKLPD